MMPEAPAGPVGGRRLVLVAMTVANAMILVDQTAVPLALPSIEKQFGVGTQEAQWVLSASLLSLSGLLILGGRLGDLFGRRRVFVIGAVGFSAASAVGGLAPDFALLLAARVVQGVGGALMLPGSVAIVNSTFPAAERGKALLTMGGVAAITGALGPTIGALTSAFSWRLVLLVNVPLAVVCLVATLSAVPKDREREGSVRVDLLGAGLLCLSIVSHVLGLTEAQSTAIVSISVLGPVAVALLGVVGFLWWERRAPEPLMDEGLLRRTPNYLGSMISQALAGFVEMGLGLIFPLLLILDLGMSPFVAGLALIPTTVPMVLLSTTVGHWYDRSGGRPPLVVGFGILGLSGLALGVGVHLLQPAAPNYFFLLPGLLVFGTGLAFVLTACDPVSLDSVDDKLAGCRGHRQPQSRREGRSGSPRSTPSSTRSTFAASNTSRPAASLRIKVSSSAKRSRQPSRPACSPTISTRRWSAFSLQPSTPPSSGMSRCSSRCWWSRRWAGWARGVSSGSRPEYAGPWLAEPPLTAIRDALRMELGSCPRVLSRSFQHNGTVASIASAPGCPGSHPSSSGVGRSGSVYGTSVRLVDTAQCGSRPTPKEEL